MKIKISTAMLRDYAVLHPTRKADSKLVSNLKCLQDIVIAISSHPTLTPRKSRFWLVNLCLVTKFVSSWCGNSETLSQDEKYDVQIPHGSQ